MPAPGVGSEGTLPVLGLEVPRSTHGDDQGTSGQPGLGVARIRLDREDGHVKFEIEENGAGFDVATTGYGTGLRGMADRLDAIGGSLDVRSAPGRGTTIAGRVPVTTRVGAP